MTDYEELKRLAEAGIADAGICWYSSDDFTDVPFLHVDAAYIAAANPQTILALLADLERLHQICRNVYEVWSGSEGIPIPETAPEGYMLQLLKQMRDEAMKGL